MKTELPGGLGDLRQKILYKIEARWIGMNLHSRERSLYEMSACWTKKVPEMMMDNEKSSAVCFERNLVKNLKPETEQTGSRTEKSDIPVIDGYGPFLIDKLREEVGVRLKTVVNKVRAGYVDGTARKALLIETGGGSVSSHDYAIIAVPLGVLKNDNPDNSIVFSPPLTKRKQQAIPRLKLGVHSKVVLRFESEDVFWSKGVPQIN